MKNWIFLIFVIVSVVFYVGCENDDDPEPTPTVDTYSVTYSLSVFGGYDSLEISYFFPHDQRRITTNPKTPWSETWTDYRLLDSVALNVTIFPLANRTMNYEWEVQVKKGGELINYAGDEQSSTTGENPDPVYIEHRQIIQ